MTSKSTNAFDGDADDCLDEIIAQYVRAIEQGDPPDRDQLLASHPELADDLRDFFQHRDRMEDLLDPLRKAAARVLNVRCPHCRNSIELVDEAMTSSINCPSCGSQFSLVGNGSTYRFPGGLKRIGQFQLIDHVGTGQFGTVWKARDLTLERTVAIKIPRSRHLEQGEAEMFLRDARTAAQLNHPNIVGVHEVGKQDDTIYIVSDFIQGATLKQWIAAKPLDSRGIAELIIKVAAALHHAHEAGVIHRDLKPGNIMMDAAGEPHVVDFGLAKRESGEITLTLEGQILGSPAYMPPEQARGEGHSVDRRADIYSLGVILFELLTGELPFRGDKQMLIVQILNDDPPPPRRLDSGVPRDLETICLKCLRKQPGQRYQTGQDLAVDLQRWLNHEPIAARPIGLHERAWSRCRRHPTIASLLALLLVVVVGSFFIAREVQQRERANRLVAQLVSADDERVPDILGQLRTNRKRAVPRLAVAYETSGEQEGQVGSRFGLALFALTGDTVYVDSLLERMLSADPPEFNVLKDFLATQSDGIVESLWETGLSTEASSARRFRACCALATYAPSDERWPAVAATVSDHLVSVPPGHFAEWAESLQPVKAYLLPSLHELFVSSDEPTQKRNFAAHSFAVFLDGDVAALYALLMESEPHQFQAILPVLAQHRSEFRTKLELELRAATGPAEWVDKTAARRQAGAAIAAFRLGLPELAMVVLRESPDPQARTRFIHWAIPFGVDPLALISHLEHESDAGVRAALMLALGEARPRKISQPVRDDFVQQLRDICEHSADHRLHATAEWLLRTWGFENEVADMSDSLVSPSQDVTEWLPRQGYIEAEGHELVVLQAEDFRMGADDSVPPDVVIGRRTPRDRPQQDTAIRRTFAIASKEVTRRQWARFAEEYDWQPTTGMERPVPRSGNCPQNEVSWYDAAAYCNWLSQQAGIPKSEWAYVANSAGEYADGMSTSSQFPVCSGYRLPTDAEWEFACRGQTVTFRSFDVGVEFLAEYACCQLSSESQLQPVGSFKPNDFGLFDMLGNAIEWCHDRGHHLVGGSVVFDSQEANEVITDRHYRILRGGSFISTSERLDSADRTWWSGVKREHQNGFRVARTIVPAAHDEARLLWAAAMKLGRQGQWREAAEKMQLAIDRFPEYRRHYQRMSHVWEYLAEQDNAMNVRTQQLNRFGQTQDPAVAHDVASSQLLFSTDFPTQEVAKLCEISNRRDHALHKRDMGLLHYRKGEFDQARNWLEEANNDGIYAPGRTTTLYFLAMAYHQLGEAELARRTRQKADSLFDNHVASSSSGDYGEQWCYWLGIQAMRNEVEQTLGPARD